MSKKMKIWVYPIKDFFNSKLRVYMVINKSVRLFKCIYDASTSNTYYKEKIKQIF